MAFTTLAAILLAALGAGGVGLGITLVVVAVRSMRQQIVRLQAQLADAHSFLLGAAMATSQYTRNRIAAGLVQQVGEEPITPPPEPSIEEQEQQEATRPGLRVSNSGRIERVPRER